MSAVEVALAGEIDLAVAEALRDRLTTATDEAIRLGVPVCVDLGAVTFLDSSGLACLARAINRLASADLGLRLVRVPASIHRVIVLGGIAERCDIEVHRTH